MINPETGRIHSSFNQTVTSTDAFFFQSQFAKYPVRTEIGREIRKAFCAKDVEHLILTRIIRNRIAFTCLDE